MSYNGSQLDKVQWDKMEKVCSKDPLLQIIWDKYKWLYNGANKRAIETIDKWVKFTEVSVDVITDNNLMPDDNELPVGEIDDKEAAMKLAALKMLQDKDDKTAERINVMLKGYYEHIRQRELFLKGLSADDAEEVEKSYLVKVAQEKRKND